MPDNLYDGSFLSAEEVGPRDFEYPFRNNGDLASNLFHIECWQRESYYTPQEFGVTHPTLTDYYLIGETDPARFGFGDLAKFKRTYARVPAQQTEWSTMWVTIPDPLSGIGAITSGLGSAQTATPNLFGDGALAANWYYQKPIMGGYCPLKAISGVAFTGGVSTLTITNHGFENSKSVVLQYGNSNSVYVVSHLLAANPTASLWSYINANAINTNSALNFNYAAYSSAGQQSRGPFSTNGKFVRCRRITDFYYPGITPGIATAADIPVPANESDSTVFIDKLLAGTGDINMQVGEIVRWKDSPIYSITKTLVAAADLLA
jgi:hypothetical protein